ILHDDAVGSAVGVIALLVNSKRVTHPEHGVNVRDLGLPRGRTPGARRHTSRRGSEKENDEDQYDRTKRASDHGGSLTSAQVASSWKDGRGRVERVAPAPEELPSKPSGRTRRDPHRSTSGPAGAGRG